MKPKENYQANLPIGGIHEGRSLPMGNLFCLSHPICHIPDVLQDWALSYQMYHAGRAGNGPVTAGRPPGGVSFPRDPLAGQGRTCP